MDENKTILDIANERLSHCADSKKFVETHNRNVSKIITEFKNELEKDFNDNSK